MFLSFLLTIINALTIAWGKQIKFRSRPESCTLSLAETSNLPGPGDAYIDDASYAQDQDDARDDYQGIRKYLAAESDGGLRAYRLGWHYWRVNVYRVRSDQRRHVERDIRHSRFLDNRSAIKPHVSRKLAFEFEHSATRR